MGVKDRLFFNLPAGKRDYKNQPNRQCLIKLLIIVNIECSKTVSFASSDLIIPLRLDYDE